MIKKLCIPLLFVFNGCTSAPTEQGGTAATAARFPALEVADLQKGQRLYTEKCATCHGRNGAGTVTGTDAFTRLKRPIDWQTEFERVQMGVRRPGSRLAMPPRGGHYDLSDQDIWDILGYIRSSILVDLTS